MAKKSKRPDLFETLRASGLRKRVAREIARAVERAPSAGSQKAIERRVRDLKALVSDLEKRATGRSGSKRSSTKRSTTSSSKRSATAKKAAATRKRNAAKRSTAAKKAARTRARK
jgi:hypothetical protein